MEKIKQLIFNGELDKAIHLLDELIADNKHLDEAFFLRGNAYRKKGDFQRALNNYLMAMELDPDGPARKAHDMLMDIMNFYNKDMYNH